jgi:ABC-type sugar transport system permease subunit
MASITQQIRALPAALVLGKARGRTAEAIIGYLFISPLMLIFGVYYAYAIVRSFWMSFTSYRFVSTAPPRFVGLQNYIDAFGDATVLRGFQNAAVFTVLNYVGAFLLPLCVALILDRVVNLRVAAAYRVVLYIPAVIPAPLIYRLWKWIYAPSIGLLNYLGINVFHVFTLPAPNWLADPTLILPSLVLIYWWWSVGIMTVFFLVGLAAIPQELYESARLDGANELDVVRHITLPLLKGTLMVWAILGVGTFGVLEPMLVLWGVGTYEGNVPIPAQTWGWYAYTLGFVRGNLPMGYASAIGWLGAAVMIGLALLFRRVFADKES